MRAADCTHFAPGPVRCPCSGAEPPLCLSRPQLSRELAFLTTQQASLNIAAAQKIEWGLGQVRAQDRLGDLWRGPQTCQLQAHSILAVHDLLCRSYHLTSPISALTLQFPAVEAR